MGFFDVIKSVSSQIQDAFTSIGGKPSENSKNYPSEWEKVTNQPNYTDGTWKTSKGYSFSVVKVQGNKILATNKDWGWRPFDLQINPQELSQDEIFAIQVTPTLRGVLVEHQGSTLKDITISGTTGLSPMRREGIS